MLNRKLNLLALLFCLFASSVFAQAPDGYYSAATGKKGAALKTALYGIIADHTVRSYANLWDDMRKTDVRADGKVWDMYSAITNYTFGDDQAGSYRKEGDVYNREHSFPKSWFNDASPMYTDLFHLVPTDGYVNGRRSNYPYGETNNPTWTSAEGFSKLGPCSLSGYSGVVFEPNDEYKGDFARNYFYMATAYEDRIASWSSPMLSGDAYPAYTDWAIAMLLRWAKQDPVSEKEIARNNAVYRIQHNRNPYIDYPGLEQYVWGTKTSTAFDPDNYEGGSGTDPDPVVPEAPVFTPEAGAVAAGTTVSISCATEGAYIYYSVNGAEETAAYPPVELTINERTSITAYSLLGAERSEPVSVVYTIMGEAPDGSGTYHKVLSDTELLTGVNYLIVCEPKSVVLSGITGSAGDIRAAAEVEISAEGTITTEVGREGLPYSLYLGGSPGRYTLYDAVNNGYLSLTASQNKLYLSPEANSDDELWDISIAEDGTTQIISVSRDTRRIQYNASSPRFACYTSNQQGVCLYRQEMTESGISAAATGTDAVFSVYGMDGRLIRTAGSSHEALRSLPRGIYILNGKVIIK